MKIVSEFKCFNGVQGVYSHKSRVCGCDMTFGLFLPSRAKIEKVPVIWFLGGLTCTHENAMVKSGIQQWAEFFDLAVVFPDTSPRGDHVADDEAFDLGQGAGFYVNATQGPWAANFQMFDYVTQELPALIFKEFPLREEAQGITGHSMGGHGALTLGMARPEQFKSVGAISPIANPTASEWGRKQFTAYLGADESIWASHDASIMMREQGYPGSVHVDVGTSDPYLELLRPEVLADAMASRYQPGSFQFHEGYDHSYLFVASILEDHVEFLGNDLHGI